MKKGATLVEVLVIIVIVGILAALLVPLIGCPSGCNSDYSTGSRTGVVVKLSYKGLKFKSWEGQMNLGATSTDGNGVAVPTVWEFSVADDGLAKQINEFAKSGKRVTLHYNQWWRKPIDIETEYVVDRIETVEEEKKK